MYAYVYDIGSDQDQETSFFLFNVKKSNHYHPVMHRIKINSRCEEPSCITFNRHSSSYNFIPKD